MDRRSKTAAELEEEVRCRLGAGDFRLTIHRSPVLGWHAMVHGNRQVEVERVQSMADTVVAQLAEHYELADEH